MANGALVLSSNRPLPASAPCVIQPGSWEKLLTKMRRAVIQVALLCFVPAKSTFTRYERWDLGWGRIAARGVDVYEIAGLKRALMRANVTEVGLRLKECLNRAQQSRVAEECEGGLNSLYPAATPQHIGR